MKKIQQKTNKPSSLSLKNKKIKVIKKMLEEATGRKVVLKEEHLGLDDSGSEALMNDKNFRRSLSLLINYASDVINEHGGDIEESISFICEKISDGIRRSAR